MNSADDRTLPAVLSSSALTALDTSARALIARAARPLRLKAGQHAFYAGDPCRNYIIIGDGSVRVSVTAESGREIVLYHVEPGEACVLTVAGLMSGAAYDADGKAERDTEAVVLPKAAFEELLDVSPAFRRLVFSSYGERLHTLISLVQEVVVKQVDRRLARFLAGYAEAGALRLTHQQIAAELNTAREVVTRLLNEFSAKGWVRLGRGEVRLTDAEALARFGAER